ncbi:MAG: hypothetical protein Q9222_001359 [Ikaeria aurantiellina]
MPIPATQDGLDQSRAPNIADPRTSRKMQPRRSDLLKSVVTVLVGPKDASHTYVTHAEMLAHHSPFFKIAMTGNWLEAKTGVIELPEDDWRVYEVFQNWLYQEILYVDVDAEIPGFLLKLWVFGDKVQVAAFQNTVIEVLRLQRTNPNRLFNQKDVRYAFDHTDDGSPLRQLILDMFIYEGPLEGSITTWLAEDYPEAFIAGVAEGYFAAFPRPKTTSKEKRPYLFNSVHYHVPQQQKSGIPGNSAETHQDRKSRNMSHMPA